MAAPERPAMRLWLSLVGMPKVDAPTLYTTMENRAAQRAISAFWVLPPKSTILLMVEATELLIWVMMNTPRKLKKALMMMAFLALMTPGGHAGCDGVGRIGPPVYEDHPQGEQGRYKKRRVFQKLSQKTSK